MAAVPSSHVQPTDNEKLYDSPHEAITETGLIDTAAVEKDNSSQDGDDALKLAGSHAQQFDEKYYLRLRRKIASTIDSSTHC